MNPTESRPGPGRLRAVGAYALAAALSLVILAWAIKLWKADLFSPFGYGGDTLDNLMVLKTMIEKGWYLHNDALGVPVGLDMHDYPFADNLDLLMMKVLSFVVPDCVFVLNTYHLLTFPLTALTAMLVFRRLRFSYPSSIVAALLYAFLPIHLFRGVNHLFIGCYWVVPLAVLVILWVSTGEPVFFRRDETTGRTRLTLFRGKALAAVAICLLASGAMTYYPIFAAFFLLVGGISCSVSTRKAYPAVTALLLVGVIGAGGVANLLPNILYRYHHGRNREVTRYPEEAEISGLKVAQLLLPVTEHRAPALAGVKTRYHYHRPLDNENDTSTLGFVAGFGFVVLLGRLLWRRAPAADPLLDRLSVLNIFGVLLATIGGVGAIVNLLLFAWIRSYNRICVFLAFFSLLASFWLLDRLGDRLARLRWGRPAFAGLMAALLAVGIWDQTPCFFEPAYANLREEFHSDDVFVHRIEAALPAGAKVYQVPDMIYPEHGWVHKMDSFDHFRAYLHSKSLRWSFGMMRGRAGQIIHDVMANLPTAKMVRTVAGAGFQGIYVDRKGYADHGAALEKELSALLKTDPMVSPRGDLSFFLIPPSLQQVQPALAAR